jgi:hypothetical protein
MELNIPMLKAQFEPFDVPHLLKLWVVLALIIFLFGIIVATSGGYSTARWFWKVHLVALGSVYVLSGACFLLFHIDPLMLLFGLPPLAFVFQGDLGVKRPEDLLEDWWLFRLHRQQMEAEEEQEP